MEQIELFEHEERGLYSSCAFEHSWRINFNHNATLTSMFKSHDGNCEWFLSFQCKSSSSYCTSEKLLCSDNASNLNDQLKGYFNYYIEVRLNDLSDKYSNSNSLKNRKIDIQICNVKNEIEQYGNIKKEECIDKLSNIVLIPFAYEEEKTIDEFVNQHGYLNIVVKIFDISNITRNCETNRLSNDFEKLLKLRENGNFKTPVEEKEFAVNHNESAAQSDDFSAKYGEQIEECVKISKIRPEAMTEFLRYVYTGEANITKEIVFDLLTAAQRYNANGLKMLCEQKIFGDLSVTNIESDKS